MRRLGAWRGLSLDAHLEAGDREVSSPVGVQREVVRLWRFSLDRPELRVEVRGAEIRYGRILGRTSEIELIEGIAVHGFGA